MQKIDIIYNPWNMNKNILGDSLITCSQEPLTGYFRNGCCDTDDTDTGMHTVCIIATKEFLTFSKKVWYDLTTPLPRFGFDGVKPGDRWCLCALRWKEALEKNTAPPVFLDSTHYNTLKVLDIADLQQYAFN